MVETFSSSAAGFFTSATYYITSSTYFNTVLTCLIYILDHYFGVAFLKYYCPNYKFYVKWFVILSFCSLPLFMVFNLYVSVVLYYLFKNQKHILYDVRDELRKRNWYKACKKITAGAWYVTAWFFHGYEIRYEDSKVKELLHDMDSDTAVMILYYHGALPIDVYYFTMNSVLTAARQVTVVVDRFLFKVPFFSRALTFWQCIWGPKEKIIQSLKEKEIVMLSPGGAREALFSENYDLIWENHKKEKRLGWAKCLVEATKANQKVVVIPMFTENLRSALDTPDFVKKNKFLRFIYDRYRWPIWPMFGGIPVKLVTYLGEKIEINSNEDEEMIFKKCKFKLEQLIKSKHRKEKSFYSRFLQRFKFKEN